MFRKKIFKNNKILINDFPQNIFLNYITVS